MLPLDFKGIIYGSLLCSWAIRDFLGDWLHHSLVRSGRRIIDESFTFLVSCDGVKCIEVELRDRWRHVRIWQVGRLSLVDSDPLDMRGSDISWHVIIGQLHLWEGHLVAVPDSLIDRQVILPRRYDWQLSLDTVVEPLEIIIDRWPTGLRHNISRSLITLANCDGICSCWNLQSFLFDALCLYVLKI